VESSDDSEDDDDDDEILLTSSDDSEDDTEPTVDVKTEATPAETCDSVVLVSTDTSDVINIDKLASIVIKDDDNDDEECGASAARGSYLDLFSS